MLPQAPLLHYHRPQVAQQSARTLPRAQVQGGARLQDRPQQERV